MTKTAKLTGGLRARKNLRPTSTLAVSEAPSEARFDTSAALEAKTEPVRARQPARPTEPVASVRDGYDGTTALNLYMREIGQVALLTIEEENMLAARIKKGDEAARDRMIRANLRLVVKIARDYEGLGLPLLDLINEGNMGLMKAVERFDPKKGAKLSSYSSWWIKQSIRRALANQPRTIRLPVHVVSKVSKLQQAEVKLVELLGREPSEEELADEVGMKLSQVIRLRNAAIVRPASLDAPMGDEDSSRLGEVIKDERALTPYEELEERTSIMALMDLIPKLDAREAAILRLRFGLDGSTEQTLEEIGKKFGVTRERIRQLQNETLEKLRRMLEEPPEAPMSN